MKNRRRRTKRYKRRIRRIRCSIFLVELVCMAMLIACCHSKRSMLIEMQGLSQEGIPTGCESVSTVMILRYLGIDITPEEFIDHFLTCDVFYRKEGALYGPDPEEVFAGNPYEKSSLGCYPGVIVNALDTMKNSNYPGMADLSYEDISGKSLPKIADRYIARGIPALLWATMDMRPVTDGMQYYLADGSLYTWRAGEHCLVLCGFDEEHYYLMDPLKGGERVVYPKAVVEESYEQMGRRAVVILKSF